MCEYETLSFFVDIPSSYPALALHQSSVRMYHASTSYAELILSVFLWFWIHKAISENRKENSKLGDVGGPPHRRKQRLSRFATATANEVEVPSLHDEFVTALDQPLFDFCLFLMSSCLIFKETWNGDVETLAPNAFN